MINGRATEVGRVAAALVGLVFWLGLSGPAQAQFAGRNGPVTSATPYSSLGPVVGFDLGSRDLRALASLNQLQSNVSATAGIDWSANGDFVTIGRNTGVPSGACLEQAVVVRRDGGVHRISNPRDPRITGCGGWPSSPAISSNGERVAFCFSGGVGINGLYVGPADGSTPPVIVDATSGADCSPTWSPDGTRIAYVLDDLRVIDLGTGVTEDLGAATPGAIEMNPDWSPDGKKIAFFSVAQKDHHYRVMTLPVDGTGGRTEVRRAGRYYAPDLSWSPDGTTLVWGGQRSPVVGSRAYLSYVEVGSARRHIAHAPPGFGSAGGFDWAPALP